jgi:hypothetical protein
MEIYNSINSKIIEFYKTKEEKPTTYEKLGWKNKEAQENRFKQLVRNFEFTNGCSINDLGTGLGDLYFYIENQNKNLDFTFHGYDIYDFMIENCENIFKNKENTFFHKIDENNEILNADYTIASGIFNLKYNANNEEWEQYIFKTIREMFEKSTIGCSFNCLTIYSDKEYMREELFYSDPLKIFDFCKRELSSKVTLNHDYGEYDFTITILR